MTWRAQRSGRDSEVGHRGSTRRDGAPAARAAGQGAGRRDRAVARQLNKACLVGCHDLQIDETAHRADIAGATLKEGDWISLDGNTGGITLGKRTIIADLPQAELAETAWWRRRS